MRRIDNSSSQDGVETTSITSSVENEVRRPPSKAKRSSIKRKIPNFNDDSDDTVNEPLLQSEHDVSEFKQSAKFVSSKSKTDSINERSDNTNIGTKVQKASPTTSSTFSENITFKSVTADIANVNTSVTAPIHNYMNTNIFGVIDTTTSKSTKSSLIVEIDNTKSSAYSPSPLIFTTAKIHTDNITKEMEPLHVTPVPILSTIEGNVIKSIPSILDSSEKYYDAVKSKSESQPKCSNENNQSNIKNSSIIKEHSATISSNIKSTVVSTNIVKSAPGQSTKQTSLDKPQISQADSKIPITSSKIEVINSISTNTLQDEKTRTTAVDKTKKDVSDKILMEQSKFENPQIPGKTNIEKQSFMTEESQKQTYNGDTAQKLSLNSNKPSVLTSRNIENKSIREIPPNSVSSFPMNKQLQRQKKTVEDISISDAKNKTTVCDPKVNISQKDSASLLEDKAKGSIINPTMPKSSLESPTKSIKDNSTEKTKIINKTNPITTVPTGNASNNNNKSGSLSTTSTGKTNIADKHVPPSSVPVVKPNTIDKPSSLTSVPLSKANITNKPDSSSPVPGSLNTTIKPPSIASAPSVTTKTAEKSTTLTSASKGTANSTIKPGSVNSVSIEKKNTVEKFTSVKSTPKEQTNTIMSKNSAQVIKSSKKDSVATSSGSNISKLPTVAKSSGKESVAEIKKVSEKPKTKISPTIASSDKSNKSIPFTATTNVLSNVASSVGDKKLNSETHATSSSSTTSSIKESTVSNLPSSSTSAKTIMKTNKNIEPMFSENNKDSRA
ncbi:PREDICTED: serine-rich adhesin for platelets-like [Papilio xuthus]|uniref:Serine-rich adhesin for platelets-like n=1 Tax=Papilio xuthus TaxID=66420 RepID=A0AAJ6ZL42_PAPXU|nr:PREDICTED: serine-rich adhesin for platelets-like [Papilio xuthus]